MRQRATVLKTEGNMALIRVSRATMCEGCEKNGGCSHCHITGLVAGDNHMEARACNKIGASVGDTVEVESTGSTVLGYAALVFLLPILVCALFYFVSSALFQSALVGALAALGGFVLTFVLIALVDRRAAKKTPAIVIVKVLTE